MRILRVIGLVTLGVVIGIGATVVSGKVTAQGPSSRLTVVGPAVEWASGKYPFRFIKDNKSRACFIVSLTGGEGGTQTQPTVTAIARADDASCN
jgi:hypothetical protein